MTTILTPYQLGVLADLGPACRLPVFQAVLDHGPDLVLVQHRHRAFGPHGAGPFVAIIQDRPLARGPDAFDRPSLEELAGKANGVLVLTGRLSAGPYVRAASLIGRGRSVLVVETRPPRAEEWRAFTRNHAPAAPAIVL
ncbi:hypothetical protein [Methylorubrum extorquens]|uniref:hypothetical protein n=1 Tax=Methylorubrum extorquens TaxID=408 RepID=UPI0020A0C07B|nr:hypothetical protein [Methylorubrum extorquens]MCP1540139.1 hypothetical protein [Methylorubrum extorquens]